MESTSCSSTSISGKPAATSSAVSRNRPSLRRRTFALWTTVSRAGLPCEAARDVASSQRSGRSVPCAARLITRSAIATSPSLSQCSGRSRGPRCSRARRRRRLRANGPGLRRIRARRPRFQVGEPASEPSAPAIARSGRTFAKRSIRRRSSTIGLRYPATAWLGDETAPNRAPAQPSRRWTVASGSALPCARRHASPSRRRPTPRGRRRPRQRPAPPRRRPRGRCRRRRSGRGGSAPSPNRLWLRVTVRLPRRQAPLRLFDQAAGRDHRTHGGAELDEDELLRRGSGCGRDARVPRCGSRARGLGVTEAADHRPLEIDLHLRALSNASTASGQTIASRPLFSALR